MSEYSPLVSTQWLAMNIDNPNIKILDATWHLPNAGRNAKEEYANAHIKGASYFDIDEIADLNNPLHHSLPNDEKMASRVRSFGISNTNHVIVYDNSDASTAARVWFMFKNFGHENVSILDGGINKWTLEGNQTTNDITVTPSGHFIAKSKEENLRNLDQIMDNIDSQKEQVVDARASGRYNGTAPEPREGLKSGHIPGSLNVPFNQLLNEDRTYKTNEEIKDIFENSGVDLNKPIITSCGSGVTACVLLFALDQIGHKQKALYGGSWSEWGAHPDTPVVK